MASPAKPVPRDGEQSSALGNDTLVTHADPEAQRPASGITQPKPRTAVHSPATSKKWFKLPTNAGSISPRVLTPPPTRASDAGPPSDAYVIPSTLEGEFPDQEDYVSAKGMSMLTWIGLGGGVGSGSGPEAVVTASGRMREETKKNRRVDERVDPRDPKFYTPPARDNAITRMKTYIGTKTARIMSDDRDVEARLISTHLYMRTRAWKRYQTNFRWGTAKFAVWWFWFYLAMTIAFIVVRTAVYRAPNWDHIYIIILMSVIVAYGAPRSATLYKIILTEVYFGVYFNLMFVSSLTSDRILKGLRDVSLLAIVATPLLILATIAVFFAWPRVLYKVQKVQFRKHAQNHTFRVVEKPLSSGVGLFTAELLTSHFLAGERSGVRDLELFHEPKRAGCVPGRSTSSAIYVGPTVDGKPHGLGHWIDRDDTGENLVGYFHNGIPVGPFESQENGAITRSLLINIRIGYMTNSHKQLKLQRVKPSFGIASCECSVSGEVILGYPKVGDVYPQTVCDCVREHCSCFKIMLSNYYRHIDDTKRLSSVVVALDDSGQSLTVTGHRSRAKKRRVKEVRIRVEQDVPESNEDLALVGGSVPGSLVLDEIWRPSTDAEAVVYICGYKHTNYDCIRRFGQFLAMARLPPYMKPLFFSWPNGRWAFNYRRAIRVAKSANNQKDFEHFLLGLLKAGVRNVSFMLHSMGARVFLYSWPRIKYLFQPLKELQCDTQEPGHASTLSDDASVASIAQDPLLVLSNLILLSPDYEVDTFESEVGELRQYCNQITVYVDQRDTATKSAQYMRGFRKSLGFNFDGINDLNGDVVDLDIVDTTDLQGNVAGTYHSYWNINRQMVDDLHDLLVLRKRAKQRTTRLLRVDRGKYRFLQTPQSVIEV